MSREELIAKFVSMYVPANEREAARRMLDSIVGVCESRAKLEEAREARAVFGMGSRS